MKRQMPVLIALVIGILFVLLHFAIELSGKFTGAENSLAPGAHDFIFV